MGSFLRLHIAACALLLLFAGACSDDTRRSDGPSCPEGQTYNPIIGECSIPPRTQPNNDPGQPDTGEPDSNTERDTGEEAQCRIEDRLCASLSVVQVCSQGRWEDVACGPDEVCRNGACEPDGCLPGTSRCASLDEFQVCGNEGVYGDVERCESGTTCSLGRCEGGCAGDLKERSNLGCDYISIRHDQYRPPLGTGTPHSVVVSNPGQVQAILDITSPEIPVSFPVSIVEPMSSLVLDFPTTHTVSQPGVSRQIFRISSDQPVIATQFAPLNNPGAGRETSDASLLLPNNVLGQEYVTLGWRALSPRGTYVDIVAASPGTTNVRVSSPIRLSGGTAGSVEAGGQTTFTIHANQVLHLIDDQGSGATPEQRDISGIVIEGTQAIAVFTGATLVNIPDGPNAIAAGDHIEQQMFPVNAWGQAYIGAPFNPRSADDFMIFRVLAARDGTTVEFDPPVNGTATTTLNRGEYFEYRSSEAILVTADRPIQLGQYMVGGSIEPRVGDGDPAFVLPPAIEQYRDEYVFLVPANYRRNFVTITVPIGVEVTLNGSVVPASEFSPFASGQWQYAIVAITGGIHTASADETFGLLVHGYDYYISYAFAGGILLAD
ncbi:MAG: hypothetical protein ACNA8W_02130 [Bradymonadaceae bacterium]